MRKGPNKERPLGCHRLAGLLPRRLLPPGEEHDLKGQANEIFRLQFFFTKRLVVVSIDMPKSEFEFCQIFVELFILKISK
jgi:hypothetical protein